MKEQTSRVVVKSTSVLEMEAKSSSGGWRLFKWRHFMSMMIENEWWKVVKMYLALLLK
jgi:hypothetical protein